MSVTMRPRKIIVGLGDSVNSFVTLRRAHVEASSHNAEVCIVHVIPEGSSTRQEAMAERQISTLIRQYASLEVKERSRIQIERGEPGPILVRMSERADLLIIGACETSDKRGIFSGSVVSFCLNRSSCPVHVCADHGNTQDAMGKKRLGE
jgi:nucleotide-binding universal stress UspA family protein